ncbi:MAG TPA: TetR/AcrR family transcriptional regulator [Anaerolineae bacterium]|nr:TetR/AcrR family transcriptional regulator [Anaerolineae bacterium]
MSLETSGRDVILDTSAKLFSQHGYNGVSIRDIAQAAGLTNAALYYHFKNKEDLFLAMLERDHEKTLTSLREAAHGPGELREDLKQLVACYAAITCERRQSFQTLRRDLSNVEAGRGHKLFGEMHSSFMRPLEERLAQGQADGEIQAGDVQLYARLLHGMIIALAHAGKPDKQRKVSPAEVEIAVNVFLKGVEKRRR